MATYFREEYQEYYDKLTDTRTLNIETKSIQNTIEEIASEYNAVYGMIDELQGDFTGELYGSIEGLKAELEGSAFVLDMFNSVSGIMVDLKDNLPWHLSYKNRA